MATSNGDENPRELPRYSGPELACHICGCEFAPGDIIVYDETSGKIFCHTELEPSLPGAEAKNCTGKWDEAVAAKRPHFIPQIFTGHARPREERHNAHCYTGEKCFCDECGYKFNQEDKVVAIEGRDLIFCTRTSDYFGPKSCYGRWCARTNPVTVLAQTLEYWGKGIII